MIEVNLTTDDPADVAIHFPEDGLTMSLPVTKLGDNLVRLEAVPFITEAANLCDIVEVKIQADGSYEFVRVVQPSNWRVYELFLSGEEAESPQIEQFCSRLHSIGCYWERNFGGCLLIGVPPDLDVDPNDLLAQARSPIQ
jgi:hypothetical protein